MMWKSMKVRIDRILDDHPSIKYQDAKSDRWNGQSVEGRHVVCFFPTGRVNQPYRAKARDKFYQAVEKLRSGTSPTDDATVDMSKYPEGAKAIIWTDRHDTAIWENLLLFVASPDEAYTVMNGWKAETGKWAAERPKAANKAEA